MLDRRSFLATLPAAALLARHSFAQAPASLKDQRAFISTTGKLGQGIFTANFDNKTGTFSTPAFAYKLAVADFLALSPKNKKRLYSTCTIDDSSAVSAFDIVDGPDPLKLINQQTAKGIQAVYLAFDPSGRVALEANWGSGSINTYLVGKDGALSPAVEHIEYGEANHGPAPQQPHSRAHSILVAPGGRFVLVNDYGTDRIYIYALDAATAKLTPHDPPFWTAPAGTAPRHLAFHPNGKWIYNNNEIANTVDFMLWDGKAGTLTYKTTIPMLPADHARSSASDLLISPDGRFLYGSNRGVNSINTWAIQRDGTLQQLQLQEQSGAQNRHLVLDSTGRWLIASNMGSGDITIFPRDPKTGMLSAVSSKTPLPGACFTLFA